MAGIHILESSLINKIAAGEVVERPSSVVKELVENSIDAGASQITIEIKDGGIGMIRIADNGKGIAREEIKTAFMRHATSKLSKFEDLEGILTLGFRGEALSSIASVAMVELVSRTKDEELASRFSIDGGAEGRLESTAANVGTTITVKNLFYNTPARRKFLKKPAVEGSHIADIVNRLALGHPEIGFKFINNGTVIFQTNEGTDIKTTVFNVYGKEIASRSLEIKAEKDGYKIQGLIVKPELARANRNYENFFINGRYIKSNLVSEAVEQAYRGKLMVGKFPIFIINMLVPDNTVDVNVHPTKLEVRFSQESFVYDLICDAVSKALNKENLIPEVEWDKKKYAEVANIEVKKEVEQKRLDFGKKEPEKDFVYNAVPLKQEPIVLNEALPRYENKAEGSTVVHSAIEKLYPQRNEEIKRVQPKEDNKVILPLKDEKVSEIPKVDKTSEPEKKEIIEEVKRELFFKDYRIVGQVFGTYWIVEMNSSMYLIDQHAAHERVLFERLKKSLVQKKRADSQLLLQSLAVELTELEKQTVEENRELLESFGFEFEPLGLKAYALRAVPYIFDNPSDASFFLEIVEMLGSKSMSSVYEAKLDNIASMSCKAAVKGNNKLSYIEAKALIEQMLEIDEPFTCPHGRPTIIEMTKNEMEKKFKRIQN